MDYGLIMDYGLWIGYGLWIEYGLWIGFGFNISELNGYGLDLELELSPSGTSEYRCHNWRPAITLTKIKTHHFEAS